MSRKGLLGMIHSLPDGVFGRQAIMNEMQRLEDLEKNWRRTAEILERNYAHGHESPAGHRACDFKARAAELGYILHGETRP